MPNRFWIVILLALGITGCRSNNPPYEMAKAKAEGEHGSEGEAKPKFRKGPPAPIPPLMPSPVPVMPEQPASPMSPGDGPKMEDKTIPSTADPAQPK